ncbi:MAG: 2-C-methyl-D-erythritol 4-phosphate cytidylyltransferase [Bacteroidaceae bacterium]|nr:2-C-methyl-D-erythritol 4-phosphate cytidylyltransferase [Bacteroidaceae bacterium]
MNIALLTAAGLGSRMGGKTPKQFMLIDSVPAIIYTLQAFQFHKQVDAIAVVCLKGWEEYLKRNVQQYNITKLRWIFEGGDTNQESISRGINGLKNVGCYDSDIILVHDGVRPLVDERIISDNIETCKRYGYAVTGMICKEAMMQLVDDTVDNIDIPRERMISTQTPHTYTLENLMKAHRIASEQKITNTIASCTLMPLTGIKEQHLVEGSERNGLKLTRQQDVEIFKALIRIHPEPWMQNAQ